MKPSPSAVSATSSVRSPLRSTALTRLSPSRQRAERLPRRRRAAGRPVAGGRGRPRERDRRGDGRGRRARRRPLPAREMLGEKARVRLAARERRVRRARRCRKARFVVGPSTAVSRSAPTRRAMACVAVGAPGGDLRQHADRTRPARRRRPRAPSRRGRRGRSARAGRGSCPRSGRSPRRDPRRRAAPRSAWPRGRTSACARPSGSPRATRSCAATRSMPVTSSVIGCSTWRRVFISRK